MVLTAGLHAFASHGAHCGNPRIRLPRCSLRKSTHSPPTVLTAEFHAFAGQGDEFKEFAIPEQFVSKWDGTKWTTECMVHSV